MRQLHRDTHVTRSSDMGVLVRLRKCIGTSKTRGCCGLDTLVRLRSWSGMPGGWWYANRIGAPMVLGAVAWVCWCGCVNA